MMGYETLWRRELAQTIAPAYIEIPQVQAVFLFGSVARGWADHFSDIEIGMVWSQQPSETDLEAAAYRVGATERQPTQYLEAKQLWAEQYRVKGMKIELSHWTQETIESIITNVVEGYDVSQNILIFEKQATVSALEKGIVLHGEAMMENWRDRVTLYPDGLAVAMIQKHLRFGAFGSREMLAQRNEIPLLYENHCRSIRLLLNLWFGLNRTYHCTFKWTKALLDEMPVTPSQPFERLERIFRAEATEGTQELRRLIEETFDLVEKHFPQIDLRAQREEFALPYESWPHPAV